MRERERQLKKRRKKSDGGYSLLELVVTIALLAVVGTGVSTLMLTATRLYASQSASVRLQSKAQLLTAQLRNYYLDADEALQYEDDVFSYTADGVRNAIVYDADTARLYLAEALEPETDVTGLHDLPLLSDRVSAFTIELPVTQDHGTPKEIVTSFTLEERGATYDVSFVTALRNHMRDTAEDETPAE